MTKLTQHRDLVSAHSDSNLNSSYSVLLLFISKQVKGSQEPSQIPSRIEDWDEMRWN